MLGATPLPRFGFEAQSRIYTRLWSNLVTVACILIPSAILQASASFQGLGDLSGGLFNSEANGISGNGLVVVGSSESVSGEEAFYWTAHSGIVGLGDLPGGSFNSQANASSFDGSVIVGQSRSTSGPEAFRWTLGGSMTGLGDLPGGSFSSTASDVSADGSVVVGTSSIEDNHEAFRWTGGEGMVGIGFIDFPYTPPEYHDSYSWAYGVSADGTVIVGACNLSPAAYNGNACYWSESTGMFSLGGLPNDAHRSYSIANAVSADGLTVVGESTSDTGGPPAPGSFYWTESDDMVGLGFILDVTWGAAHKAAAVSADGSSVVGTIEFSRGNQAYLWTPDQGIRLLQDILADDLGLDIDGWTLEHATGISDDGLTIVGNGMNPNGDTEAFIVTLPEPGTFIMIALGITALQHRRSLSY